MTESTKWKTNIGKNASGKLFKEISSKRELSKPLQIGMRRIQLQNPQALFVFLVHFSIYSRLRQWPRPATLVAVLHLGLSTLHPDFQARRRSGEKHLTFEYIWHVSSNFVQFQEKVRKDRERVLLDPTGQMEMHLTENKHLMPGARYKN